MKSIKEVKSFANKIVLEAKKELAKEKEENLKKQAKTLLADIQEAKKTVSLKPLKIKSINNYQELY